MASFPKYGKRLPDAQGAVLNAVGERINAGVSLLPRWAELALQRREDVPGRVLPMYLRWHQPCPVCGRAVFLIHPYLMPALEEISEPGGESDLEALGIWSITDPMCLIRTHEPCRFYDRSEPWDFTDSTVKTLKDYLK